MGSHVSVTCRDETCLTLEPNNNPTCDLQYCVNECTSSHLRCDTSLGRMEISCSCAYADWYIAMIVAGPLFVVLGCCLWGLVCYDVGQKKKERVMTMNVLQNPLRPIPTGTSVPKLEAQREWRLEQGTMMAANPRMSATTGLPSPPAQPQSRFSMFRRGNNNQQGQHALPAPGDPPAPPQQQPHGDQDYQLPENYPVPVPWNHPPVPPKKSCWPWGGGGAAPPNTQQQQQQQPPAGPPGVPPLEGVPQGQAAPPSGGPTGRATPRDHQEEDADGGRGADIGRETPRDHTAVDEEGGGNPRRNSDDLDARDRQWQKDRRESDES